MSEELGQGNRRLDPHAAIGQTELQENLEHVRSLASRQRQGKHLLLILLAGLACTIFIAAADYCWPLPFTLRATGGMLVLAICLGMTRQVARRTRYAIRDAACDIEAAFPKYGQRVRTTVDYTVQSHNPAPAAPNLVSALEAETQELTSQDDLTRANSPRAYYAALTACLFAVVACMLCLVLVPEFRITAARVFLFPLHYTTVSIAPIEQPVALGANLRVQVDVQGRPIQNALVCYRIAESEDEWSEVQLVPVGGRDKPEPIARSGRLTATIEDCREDLELLVVAGPKRHPVQRVHVTSPLTLVGFSAQVAPPPYLGREPHIVDKEVFSVPEGSHLKFQFTLNRSPANAMLQPEIMEDPPKPMNPMRLLVAENIVSGELADLRQSFQFTLHAEAADRMSLDSNKFHVRVQLDKKPQIRFVSPEEDLEVIPTTEIPLALEADDDIGLVKTGIVYKIGDGTPQTLCEQDYSPSDKSVYVERILALEGCGVTCRDAVTYYAFAEDNYFGQPRRVSSGLRFVDIRPFKREYQILPPADGSCGACQGESVTLEGLIRRQRGLLSDTFPVRDQKSAPALRTENLANTQQEILDITSEFWQQLSACAGPVPPLEQACEAMEAAEASLRAGSVAIGFKREEVALASLVDARQNVRKLLQDSNSAQASQCRNIDRQQKQKLRRPKREQPEAEKEESEQLARTCQNLQQMADEERRWASKACSSSKPSSENEPSQTGSESEAESRDELARQQQSTIKRAEQTMQDLQGNSRASQLSEQRMESAVKAMRAALERLSENQREDAAEGAEHAAQRLDGLAEHVARLNEPDFEQRLAQAGHLARELAGHEQGLVEDVQQASQSRQTSVATSLGDRQNKVIKRTEELEELTKRLSDENVDQTLGIHRVIEEARDANPSEEFLQMMRQAAAHLEAKLPARAVEPARQASQSLEQLADALQEIHRLFTQPDLEEMLAAERQAANLLQRFEAARSPGERAVARSRVDSLQTVLTPISQRDARLARAERGLRAQEPTGPSTAGLRSTSNVSSKQVEPENGPRPGQFEHSDQLLVTGLREVTRVLQKMILEANLERAMANPDATVPPAYRDMVNKYYEELSRDSR